MKKIIAILSVLLITSCASILNEDTTPVNISTSNGKKIDVLINGQMDFPKNLGH